MKLWQEVGRFDLCIFHFVDDQGRSSTAYKMSVKLAGLLPVKYKSQCKIIVQVYKTCNRTGSSVLDEKYSSLSANRISES